MAVNIDINLQAEDVQAEIAAIGTELAALDKLSNRVDINFDASEITGEIGKVVEQLQELEDLELNADKLERQISDIETALDKEIETKVQVEHLQPDGKTGSGDSTGGDPPGGDGSLSRQRLQKKAADLVGLNAARMGRSPELDSDKLGDTFGDFENTVKRLTGDSGLPGKNSLRTNFFQEDVDLDSRSWQKIQKDAAEANVLQGGLKNIGRDFDPDDLSFESLERRAHETGVTDRRFNTDIVDEPPSQMSWNKLQRKASEAGVFDGKVGDIETKKEQSTKEALAKRLRDKVLKGAGLEKFQKSDMGLEEILRQEVKENTKSTQKAVKDRLRTQYFGDFDGELYDSEGRGMISAKEARRHGTHDRGAMAADHPVLETGDSGEGLAYRDKLSFLTGDNNLGAAIRNIEKQQKELFENAGLDPERVKKRDDIEGSLTEATFGDDDPMRFNREKRREAGLTDMGVQTSVNMEDYGDLDADADISPGPSRSGGGGLGKSLRTVRRLKTTRNQVESLSGSVVRKLKPSMSQVHNAMAAVLPVLFALGTQLLGVAAAMGSVATAGAGIIGLGLLGHAESMSGSFKQAKEQLQALKEDAFEAAQPTMQLFAPAQSRLFDAIPGQIQEIADSMEGLQHFEGTLSTMGNDLSEGIQEFFNIVNRNRGTISQLSIRFGRLIGGGLLGFFEDLLNKAEKNQDFLVSLGRDVLRIISTLYQLSMAISIVVTAFSPFFVLLQQVSKWMRNDLLLVLIQLVGWMYALAKVSKITGAIWFAFKGIAPIIGGVITVLQGYQATAWQATMATLALVSALTMGLGAVGAFGGISSLDGPGMGGGSSLGVGTAAGGGTKNIYHDNREYTINSQGEMDNASRQNLRTTLERVSAENTAQNPVNASGDNFSSRTGD